MAAKFKKGSKVRQVVPAIVGEVTETKYDEDSDSLQYHVTYKDADGNESARWFTEAQLEEHSA